MSDLAAIFRAELFAASSGAPSPAGAAGLSAALASACARGRAAHPGLRLDDETFVRHLARLVTAADDEVAAALEAVAVEDVYLACACVHRVAGAADRFVALCANSIRAALAGVAATAAEREDVEQQLRLELLLGRDGRAAKIRSYRGSAPLARWAAIAARRLALSMLRARLAEARARAGAAVADGLDWRDPAVALLKQRYRSHFQRALEDAVAAIDDRDRLLLRLHLVRGATTRRIAKMYQVTQPTASRWLEQARRRVVDEMVRLLRERLKLSVDEIESLAALVRSQIDVSLSALLRSAE